MIDTIKALKAFEFAMTSAIVITALSLAIIAITAFVTSKVELKESWLRYAWIAYLGSIFWGVLNISKLTGTFAKTKLLTTESIYSTGIMITAGSQIILFLIATMFVIIAIWKTKEREKK